MKTEFKSIEGLTIALAIKTIESVGKAVSDKEHEMVWSVEDGKLYGVIK